MRRVEAPTGKSGSSSVGRPGYLRSLGRLFRSWICHLERGPVFGDQGTSHVDIRLVQKQLGHRSIQTTQICAGALSEDAASAVENLPQ